MPYYAYIHCKPDGTPFYVGKGNGDRVRRIKRKNKGHIAIVSKHGEESILVAKMECSTDEISKDLERGLIKRLKAMGSKLVNATEGGDGCTGYKPSPEVLLKLSLAKKGKPLTDAQLIAQRAAAARRVGVKRPHAKRLFGDDNPMRRPENRQKISQAMKGNKIWLGRSLSDEHKKKIGDANRGNKLGEAQKKLLKERHTGTKWATNGTEFSRVNAFDMLPRGWWHGRPPRSKK